MSIELRILHIFWYVVLLNPVKRQLNAFRYVNYRHDMVAKQIKVAMAV